MATAIAGILTLGRAYLATQTTADIIVQMGEGMGTQTDQTLTRADVMMQHWLADRLQGLTFLDGIQFEGMSAPIWFNGKSHGLLAFVDEVDGSQNQVLAAGQLSHSAVVTLVRVPKDRQTIFSDIVAAVMLNYIDGSVVCAFRTEDGRYQTETIGRITIVPQEQRAKLLAIGDNRLDVGNWPFYADIYYPDILQLVSWMFAGRKGNVRSLGNSASEAALAAVGRATGYLSLQKYDEAGAIWAIARGARAHATTFDGSAHDGLAFPIGHKGNVELVIGPTREVGTHIVELIQRAKTTIPSTT
jgi:fructose-1,6-bisphosphatase/inositol monophosphatase family enzyme